MQVPGHPVAMQPNMGAVNKREVQHVACFPPLFSLAYYSQQHVHQVPGMVSIASQPAHPCLLYIDHHVVFGVKRPYKWPCGRYMLLMN